MLLASSLMLVFGAPFFPGLQLLAVEVVQSPIPTFASLLVVVGVLTTVPEPVGVLAEVAARGVTAWRTLRIIGLSCLGITVCLVLNSGSFSMIVCTVSCFVGEGLISAKYLGFSVSWAFPVLHCGAALLFGISGFNDIATWAWFLTPHPTVSMISASLILFFLGLFVISRAEEYS